MMLWKTPDGVSLDTLAEEATVSDLVEALRETGEAIERKDHFVSWGKRFLVVPLGEDAE